jgi:DNA-binding NarL/FixJ family response regulator
MEKEMPVRVLIADGQSKVRFALRVLLERQPGFEVVGEAVYAQDLLTQVEASQPELARGLPGLARDRPQRAARSAPGRPGCRGRRLCQQDRPARTAVGGHRCL